MRMTARFPIALLAAANLALAGGTPSNAITKVGGGTTITAWL